DPRPERQLDHGRDRPQVWAQYVGSPVYADALALRDRDPNGSGTLSEFHLCRFCRRSKANFLAGMTGKQDPVSNQGGRQGSYLPATPEATSLTPNGDISGAYNKQQKWNEEQEHQGTERYHE